VTLGLLRPFKGILIALQFKHKAQEGRLASEWSGAHASAKSDRLHHLRPCSFCAIDWARRVAVAAPAMEAGADRRNRNTDQGATDQFVGSGRPGKEGRRSELSPCPRRRSLRE